MDEKEKSKKPVWIRICTCGHPTNAHILMEGQCQYKECACEAVRDMGFRRGNGIKYM